MTETMHGRDRRAFFRRLAGVATLAAAGWSARAASADDQALDALIGDTQHGEFGQTFDEASRTIHMPRPSEPTVSTATAQTTEKAIDRYARYRRARRLAASSLRRRACGSAIAIRA